MCAFPNRYFTENSRWVPLSTLLRGVEEWNGLKKSGYDAKLFPQPRTLVVLYLVLRYSEVWKRGIV